MKPLYIVAVCAFVLALVCAPIAAQTSETYEEGKDDDDTWKKVAIILPIVFGGLSLLIFFCYCCCCAGAGQGWGCRDCSQWGCGDCRNCGNCGNCGDCRNCGAMCNCGDCRNCGDMCRCNCGDCGYCFGDCCRGCCMEPGYNGDNRVIYSSSQGPIRVEEAYNYRSQPPQAYNAGYSNDRTFVSSIPVNGVDRYPVSGGIRSGGDVYGGFGVYGNSPNYLSYPPVTRQAGCGCR